MLTIQHRAEQNVRSDFTSRFRTLKMDIELDVIKHWLK